LEELRKVGMSKPVLERKVYLYNPETGRIISNFSLKRKESKQKKLWEKSKND
jgi:hypothetical protein